VLIGAPVVLISVFAMLAYVVAAAAVFLWDAIRTLIAFLSQGDATTERRPRPGRTEDGASGQRFRFDTRRTQEEPERQTDDSNGHR
jgi:hypothetical protein